MGMPSVEQWKSRLTHDEITSYQFAGALSSNEAEKVIELTTETFKQIATTYSELSADESLCLLGNIRVITDSFTEKQLDISKIQQVQLLLENHIHSLEDEKESQVFEELLKACSNGDIYEITWNLNKITKEERRYQIALSFINHAKSSNSPEDSMNSLLQNLYNFNLEEHYRLELAKEVINFPCKDLSVFVNNFKYFQLDENSKFIIAKMLLEMKAYTALSSIELSGLRSEYQFSILTLAVEMCPRDNSEESNQALAYVIETVKNCKLTQTEKETLLEKLSSKRPEAIYYILKNFTLSNDVKARLVNLLKSSGDQFELISRTEISNYIQQCLIEQRIVTMNPDDFLDYESVPELKAIYEAIEKNAPLSGEASIELWINLVLYNASKEEKEWIKESKIVNEIQKLKNPKLRWMLINAVRSVYKNKSVREKKYTSFPLINLMLAELEGQGVSDIQITRIATHIDAAKKRYHDTVRHQYPVLHALCMLSEASILSPLEKQELLMKMMDKVDESALNEDSSLTFINQSKLLTTIFNFNGINCLKTCKSLSEALEKLFKEKIPIDTTGIDFGKQWQEHIERTFQNPFHLFAFAGALNRMYDPLKSVMLHHYAIFIRSLLTDSFEKMRYDLDANPHLKLFAEKINFTDWKTDITVPVTDLVGLLGTSATQNKALAGCEIEFTGKPDALISSGENVIGSCLRLTPSTDFTFSLLGICLNGAARMITLNNPRGQTLARSFVRLTWDDTNKKVVLFQDKTYFGFSSSEQYSKVLEAGAKDLAKRLKIPYAKADETPKVKGTLTYYRGPVHEYSDAFFGANNLSSFTISNFSVIDP